jgi:hypothetical protein
VIGLLLVAALAGVPEPSYIVERIVGAGQGNRRVSVYRDGVLALSTSDSGGAPTVRRRSLNEVELRVVRQVVEECHEALLDGGYRFEAVEGDTVEIRLAPPGREALRARVALAAVRPLAMVRIEQALDELEKTMCDGPSVRGDFSAWVPSVGDGLELDDGRTVTVLEVMAGDEDLVIHVRIGDGPAAAYFFLAELRQRAARRVER